MRIFYTFIILVLTCHSIAFSQTGFIRGQVKTKFDSVLAGASVTIKGNPKSFITNDNGEFSITNLKLPAVLVFSAVGHKTLEYAVKKTDTAKLISIKLSPVEAELSEVVVIGYGTAKKKAMTGSISTPVILRGTSTPAAKALEGRVPGVSVSAGLTGPVGTAKSLKNDSKPATAGRSAATHSKILTAGELSDFKKWKLWGG